MSGMSDFRKQMQLVNEPGLANEQAINESKQTKIVNSDNSMTNYVMTYKQMLGEDVTEQKTENSNGVINEETRFKAIGALQVVKELLEGDINKDTVNIVNKVKQIINNI